MHTGSFADSLFLVLQKSEDPVKKALSNYSIITSNHWAPDVP